MSDLTDSASFLKCPSDFDIRETIVYYPSPRFNMAYLGAPANQTKYTLLNEGFPAYYFADGKFWQESVLPADIQFEVCHDVNWQKAKDNIHYHTTFILHGDKLHIDHVFAWGSGPASGQHYARIYVNDQICSGGVYGGNSFGMNWSFNFPVMAMTRKNFLIHRLKFYPSLKKSFFPAGDEDCPLRIFYPIGKPDLPFKVFTFDKKTLEKIVLNTGDVELIENLFKSTAAKHRIQEAITKIINKLEGQTLSDYSIMKNIGGILFDYAITHRTSLAEVIEPIICLGQTEKSATTIAEIILDKIR